MVTFVILFVLPFVGLATYGSTNERIVMFTFFQYYIFNSFPIPLTSPFLFLNFTANCSIALFTFFFKILHYVLLSSCYVCKYIFNLPLFLVVFYL